MATRWLVVTSAFVAWALLAPGAVAQLGPGLDLDDDGLDEAEELLLGTNPLLYDTDGDGIGDGDEVAAGTDPLDPNDPPPMTTTTTTSAPPATTTTTSAPAPTTTTTTTSAAATTTTAPTTTTTTSQASLPGTGGSGGSLGTGGDAPASDGAAGDSDLPTQEDDEASTEGDGTAARMPRSPLAEIGIASALAIACAALAVIGLRRRGA